MWTPIALDEQFPEWGDSRYVRLALRAARCRLADLLNHLYVLLPVLDDDKHYWVDEAEIEKLMRRGEGWLAASSRARSDRSALSEEAGPAVLPGARHARRSSPAAEDPAETSRAARSSSRSASRCEISASGRVQSVLQGVRCASRARSWLRRRRAAAASRSARTTS